ncbi:MetQ/NlpA family ABC transporter substrate-binding protein [Corynebacterium bovis]|uniref:MetQ/NlpA family ABC transporter substrate-binding protein n=1 Tax=Corynebacterium bovis TaxID=36808 RepID=UPI00244D6AA1|nr:MetQ/NlpA family ABC transporter substrate-binding protein [Corynebacterium bovis]MDH2455601.1 MetQ/NlpA family ABC transporter substrate-binding protein [Corynebacterium bovis]
MSHRRPLFRTVTAGVVALASALSLAACMDDGTTPGDGGDTPIRIGATEADKSQWQVFKKKAEEAGVKVDVESFTDYTQPNRALGQGDIDTNQFQHIQFLAKYNVESGDSLVPVGATQIFPLGLYTKGDRSIAAVAAAGRVAVPNDQTNQGRAINVLASAGLVTLKSKDKLAPTPADIDTDRSKVTVVPVDAAQTATAFNDGTPAVINNTFLSAAGVTAADAVAKDDPKQDSAKPYINVFVTTEARKDDPTIAKLVEIWHDPEVQKAVSADSQGTAVEVNTSPEELRQILRDTEDKFRAESN